MGDTPETHTQRAATTTPESTERARSAHMSPSLWQVILIALVAIVFTAIFLAIHRALADAMWPTNFFATRRWTIPVGVLGFSLMVGLAQKYLRAPTVIKGGVVDAFKGGEQVDYSTFPGALVSALSSLLSGVSVGPEAPIGLLVQDIAEWMRERLAIAQETALGFRVAAMASAYNGIVGSALFTGALATELGSGGVNGLAYLSWNLLAGVIGYSFFTLLHLQVFAQYIPFAPISALTPLYLLVAIVLGVLGAAVAILVALAFRVCGGGVERVFGDRVVLRAFVAGLITAVIVLFVPEVMFAGETQIFPMIHDPASYGVLALLGLAILKLSLLALSIKSGFLGGPTFPLLFSCTMIGLAMGLLFPGVPVSIFVLCIESAAITLALRAPLTAILIVAIIGTADPYQIALLVTSSAVALVVGAGVQRLQGRRADRTRGPKPAPSPSRSQ